MAKSKRSPALFELLDKRANGKGTEKLAVPTWFKGPQPATPGVRPPEAATTTDRTLRPQVPEKQDLPPVATSRPTSAVDSGLPAPKPSSPADGHPPVLRFHSGRVELSLHPINAVIVTGVILLTLFSSYLIGQNIGAKRALNVHASRRGQTDDIQQALNRPPDPGVLNVANRVKTLIQQRTPDQPERPPVSEAGVAPTVTEGSSADPKVITNYVVVESFNLDHRKSAEYVQKWLAEQGLETELKQSGNRWRLVTTGGYDVKKADHKAARDRLIEDLKSLGPACAEALRHQGLPEYWLKDPMATR